MYQQNLAPALAALNIGESALTSQLQQAESRITAFLDQVKNGDFPAFGTALHMPEESANAIAGWNTKYEHVLILGLGGSSLGGRLIDTFADPAHVQTPRLHFLDHLDPIAIGQLITHLPLEKTALIAISKSGSTLETTTQLTLFASAFHNAALTMEGRCVVVTEPTANPIREWATAHNVPCLTHNPALGGRYSFFAETGTLPAILKGLNPADLHRGAQKVLSDWIAGPLTSAPALGAALQSMAPTYGKSISVMYAYGEPYRILPAWYEQLWAESLGKNGQGTTPLGASGPSSQHSIQQLFLDGPIDKLFTIILPQTLGTGPAAAGDVTLGTLQQAMGQGTVSAFAARNHPVRVIEMPAHSTEALGALLMHIMLETVLTACIWNLNPFDQPAVEESKKTSLAALAELKNAA